MQPQHTPPNNYQETFNSHDSSISRRPNVSTDRLDSANEGLTDQYNPTVDTNGRDETMTPRPPRLPMNPMNIGDDHLIVGRDVSIQPPTETDQSYTNFPNQPSASVQREQFPQIGFGANQPSMALPFQHHHYQPPAGYQQMMGNLSNSSNQYHLPIQHLEQPGVGSFPMTSPSPTERALVAQLLLSGRQADAMHLLFGSPLHVHNGSSSLTSADRCTDSQGNLTLSTASSSRTPNDLGGFGSDGHHNLNSPFPSFPLASLSAPPPLPMGGIRPSPGIDVPTIRSFSQQKFSHNPGFPTVATNISLPDTSQAVTDFQRVDRSISFPENNNFREPELPSRPMFDSGLGKRPFLSVDTMDSPANLPSVKRKRRRSQRKKPNDMPRRPLSAYNLFFSEERDRILQEIDGKQPTQAPTSTGAPVQEEDKKKCRALNRPLVPSEKKRRPHRKTHGKVSFRVLAQMVGQRWKRLSNEQRKHYQDLADVDMKRHKEAMEKYYRKQAELKKKEFAGKKEADNEQREGSKGGIEAAKPVLATELAVLEEEEIEKPASPIDRA